MSTGEPLDQFNFTKALIERAKDYNFNNTLATSVFGNFAELLKLSRW